MKTFLVIILLFMCVAVSEAGGPLGYVERAQNMVGEIVKLEGTRVHIKEERSIDTYHFFAHANKLKSFQMGDRVRVYFYHNNDRLISMKKMTPLECEEGQNLGLVSGCKR